MHRMRSRQTIGNHHNKCSFLGAAACCGCTCLVPCLCVAFRHPKRGGAIKAEPNGPTGRGRATGVVARDKERASPFCLN